VSSDEEKTLIDEITITTSKAGNPQAKIMAQDLHDKLMLDNQPVFFYGKPGMPIRYIMGSLPESAQKVYWLIYIRDSILKRFDCYKERAKEFLQNEPEKELCLVFHDIFMWKTKGDEKMFDQRKILEDQVSDQPNPRLRNIFFESTYEGAKNFMEQLANAGLIVTHGDHSVQMEKNKKEERIGELNQGDQLDLERDNGKWDISVVRNHFNGEEKVGVKKVRYADKLINFVCILPEKDKYTSNLLESLKTWKSEQEGKLSINPDETVREGDLDLMVIDRTIGEIVAREQKDLNNMYFYGEQVSYILSAGDSNTQIIKALKKVSVGNIDEAHAIALEGEIKFFQNINGECQK